MGVYLYPSGTETVLKNAYIWYTREPWANTIAYYTFEWDANDYSWNGNNLSVSWDVSYTTINWKQVVYIQWKNKNNTARLKTVNLTLNVSPQTYSIRCEAESNWIGSPYWMYLVMTWQLNPRIRNWIGNPNYSSPKDYILFVWNDIKNQTTVTPDVWDGVFHHIVATMSPTECCFYRDGVKVWTFSWQASSSYTGKLYIWCNDDTNYAFNGYIWETILESKARSEQQVLDYFNQTKADYWIS